MLKQAWEVVIIININYHVIFSIFHRVYSTTQRKKINIALLSIIDPNYCRLKDDDFAYEQLHAKRNISRQLVNTATNLSFKDALENTQLLTSTFNNEKNNSKIKFLILKLTEYDPNYFTDKNPMYDTNCYTSNKFPQQLSFKEFIVNFILYAVRYGHQPIKQPISKEILDRLEAIGIEQSPYLFLENNADYLKKYESYYKEACEFLSQIKTILYNNKSVDFYDIYVAPDVSTSVNKIRDESYRDLKGGILSAKNYITTFGKYTSIIAPGGLGKSMLLKHLFLCNSKLSTEHQANILPIFIQVRSFDIGYLNLEEMLYQEVSKYISINRDQFFADMKLGNFLLLFDGLDELKINCADYFFEELNKLTVKYPHNYFVTSSRPSEQANSLNQFTLLNLKGFTLERATKMVSKLPDINENIKKDFCDKLKSGEFKKNSEIASNPLLLTLMFIIFINKGKIPSKTYQFYEEAFSVLFYKHDEIKGYKNRKFHTNLKRLTFLKYLSEFCFLSLTEQAYSFKESEYLSIISNSSLNNAVDPDDFLFDLTENLNLLYREAEEYHFIHRSFQEYFAAFHCNLMSDDKYENLISWFNNLRRKGQDHIIYFYPVGTGIFNFLYEMDEDKIKTKIIIPYLSSFLSNSGQELNDFLYFIDKAYGNIEYGFQVALSAKEQLLTIIIDRFNFESYVQLPDDLPDYEKYRSMPLWFVNLPPGENVWALYEIEGYIERHPEFSREEILEDFGINLDNPSFYNYSIPISDIIANPDFFDELIHVISNKKCELWQNYINFKKLLKAIIEK